MISRFRNITQANTLKINNKRSLGNNDNRETKGNSNPNFKGPIDAAFSGGSALLNFLNTNPAIGACFVDFGFMVTPRTWVDMGRSKNAGIETGIREASGTANHAFVGLDGFLAAAAVSYGFNKANGVKAHRMFIDSDAIDTLHDVVKTSETATGYDTKKYWTTFFENIKGLNSANGGEVWKNLSDETITEATKIMTDFGSDAYKVPKSTLEKVSELVIKDIDAGENVKIEKEIVKDGQNIKIAAEGSIKNLVNNANAMLKAVKDKATHDGTKIVEDLPNFLKGVKNRKLATVGAGLAIPVAIGMAAQPFNRYLTKRRTGQDGFVGVEGRKPDHSTGFKVLKTVTALGIGSAMIASILKHPQDLYLKTGKAVSEIASKLQYKGFVPTLNQFKFIYGMTIMSRLMASRDKNELRESTIKDTLGFANWLILGGFVSKIVLGKKDKSLINYDKAVYGNSWWNKLTKSVEKTHEEILYPTLKKLGISVVDEQGKVKGFGKLVKAMTEAAKSPEITTETAELIKKTSKQLKYKNVAQVLGYLYSGLVLGVGIPKLNIAITKYADKKQHGNSDASSKMRVPEMPINPDNKTFSAFGAYLQ